LTMNHLGYQNISFADVLDKGTATHVVTAVLYGAQAFFVFDRKVSTNENIKDIEGTFKVQLKKSLKTKGNIEGKAKIENREEKLAKEFSCSFYGDFVLENNPVSYEDAIKVSASLPKLFKGHGLPLQVWLYPLEKLSSKAAKLVQEISITLVCDAQVTLEKLSECDKKCNDILEAPGLFVFSATQEKVRLFQMLNKQHRQILQKEIAKVLPQIRMGEAKENELVSILTRESQSPFSSRRLSEFIDQKLHEIKVVNSYLTLLKEVRVIADQTELEDVVLGSLHQSILVFAFTSLQEEPYLTDWKQWLENPVSFSPKCAQKRYYSWVEDKDTRRKGTQLAESFSKFAEINHSTGKTRFLVASVPDQENKGVSIHLYERGHLVSTNFQLPVKPPPPQIGGVTHDCVELILTPASGKKEEILYYWVQYRVVGSDTWSTKCGFGEGNVFKVSELQPSTEYQFRFAQLYKIGWGEKSDVSSVVKCNARPLREPFASVISLGEKILDTFFKKS
ncbi:stonustoxin subunit alpha-like, partial [Gracilinanus agilis]|uniref:stonustoxin subunit alpha-like n=1 Tax=Gracilinanus agilis TaxID=191870 RepID=UPI001CFCCDB1